MQKLGYLFVFLSASLLAGCIAQCENPYFVVKSSSLNWVNIRQYDSTGRQPNVHVEIYGNGQVFVREGTSPLVSNSFANNAQNENWNDIRESRATISEDETIMIFQSLVNSGLFVKREKSLFAEDIATNETFFVYATANIQNKTTGSTAPITDPELLETLKMTVSWFYQPRPIKKKPAAANP